MANHEELSPLDKMTAMDLAYWPVVVGTREEALSITYTYVPYAEVAQELRENIPTPVHHPAQDTPEQPQQAVVEAIPPQVEESVTWRRIGKLIVERSLDNLGHVLDFLADI